MQANRWAEGKSFVALKALFDCTLPDEPCPVIFVPNSETGGDPRLFVNALTVAGIRAVGLDGMQSFCLMRFKDGIEIMAPLDLWKAVKEYVDNSRPETFGKSRFITNAQPS